MARPRHIAYAVAEIAFKGEAPPPSPPGPPALTPPPAVTDDLPNPFADFHPVDPAFNESTRALERAYDQQAGHSGASGDGSALWGFIRVNSARRLLEFIPTASEAEAQALVDDEEGYVAVAQITFLTRGPALVGLPAEAPNPFTQLLAADPVRPIPRDLLPGIRAQQQLFEDELKRHPRAAD